MQSKESIILLCEAAANNDCKTISELLEKDASLVNIPHPENNLTPVNFALKNNNLSALQLLVEHNANLQVPDIIESALDKPNPDLAIIQFLKTKKVFELLDMTPLLEFFVYAASKGFILTSQMMLNLKIIDEKNIDYADKDKCTALISSIEKDQLAVSRFLLEKNASKKKARAWRNEDANNINLLMSAAKSGKVETCRFILEHNLVSNINSEDSLKRSALIMAIIYQHLDVAQLLIDKGANDRQVNTWTDASNENRNILHSTSIENKPESVKFLFDRGYFDQYNIDKPDRLSCTPFETAILSASVACAKLLFSYGASGSRIKDLKDPVTENTILHAVAENNDEEVFCFLVENNFVHDISARNKKGLTALELASLLSHEKILSVWIDSITAEKLLLPSFNFQQLLSGLSKNISNSIHVNLKADCANQNLSMIMLESIDIAEKNESLFCKLDDQIIEKIDTVKNEIYFYNKKLLELQEVLKNQYNGKTSNKKYPEFENILKKNTINAHTILAFSKKYLEQKLLEKDMDSLLNCFTRLLDDLKKHEKDIKKHKKNHQTKIDNCERWIKQQRLDKMKNKNKKNNTVSSNKNDSNQSCGSMEYYFDICQTYKSTVSVVSKCLLAQNIRRYSVFYYIAMTIQQLNKLNSHQTDFDFLLSQIYRSVLRSDISNADNIKVYIKNEIEPHFRQHPTKAISSEKLNQFVHCITELKTNNNRLISDSPPAKIERICDCLFDIKEIMTDLTENKIKKQNVDVYGVIQDSCPHQFAAIKMIIITIASQYEFLIRSGINIPDSVKAGFKIDTEDFISIKNKLINQSEHNDQIIFNTLKKFCQNIDKTIRDTEEWNNHIQNSLGQGRFQFFKNASSQPTNTLQINFAPDLMTSSPMLEILPMKKL